MLHHQRISRLPEPRQKQSLILPIQCLVKSRRIRTGHLSQNQTRHLIFKLAKTRLQFRPGDLLILLLCLVLSLQNFDMYPRHPKLAQQRLDHHLCLGL